ncbi:MAG: AI-2E family transporter [Phycisphaerae bacterium]|nr:AI-2E family transporter [Gemmatimonadaceae bacterium]
MTEQARTRIPAADAALVTLALLAVLYSLHFGRAFLVPIAFALLLDFLLSPLVRVMSKGRVPTTLAAAIVTIGLVCAIGFTSYSLAGPAQKFLQEAPSGIAKARQEIDKVLLPLERVSQQAVTAGEEAGVGEGDKKPAEVVVVGPSLGSRMAGVTQRALAGFTQVMLLLFFLLAGGDLFLEKTIRLLPVLSDKKKAVRIARDIESAISVYLIANLGINLVEGIMVAGALWALGMSNPLLWGVLTVAMEFIPFIGPILMLIILTIAAMGTFDTLGQILLVPAAFFVANFIQGNIVTTMVLGKRLALNSVALFVGLAFWFWIWGIPGAFIGVPLMAVLKVCCDHVEALAPFGEFLGARTEPARVDVVPDTSPT